MVELELERVEGERRLYEVAGVGTIRLMGFTSRAAAVTAGERSWRVSRRGLFGRDAEAIASDATVVGSFTANGIRRGGALRWEGRELSLRPASSWRERYAVVDGERELALLEGKGWAQTGKDRPLRRSCDRSWAAPLRSLCRARARRGRGRCGRGRRLDRRHRVAGGGGTHDASAA